MLGRMVLAFLLLCAVFFSAASDVSVVSSLDRSGVDTMNVKMQFSDYAGKEFSMYLLGDIDGVTAKDASGLVLPVDQQIVGNYTKISFKVPSDYVELDITSSSQTLKSETEWHYESGMRFSDIVRNFSAILSLPEGARLLSTNGEVSSESGGLELLWSAQDFDTSKEALMLAGYLLEPQGPDINLIIGGVVAAIIIVGLAYLYLAKKPQEGKPGPAKPAGTEGRKLVSLEAHPLFKTLDENDKEAIREIIRQGGKTTQAHLFLYTHIPKATLSRRLASLEGKGIIARSQKGNRKLVSVTDIFKE